MLLLCYPNCKTCRKAMDWLQTKGHTYSERNIKEQNPTYEELSDWYKKSGLPLKRFFNTSGHLYKDLQLKDKLADMTEEEQLRLLATNGMLVKRPLLVLEDSVLVGFRESDWWLRLR
ncbi:MAG: arsenate reductase family protein [Oscillospiraceae bacterium]|nr:arsenate reductase family protein [Oscillospiraceae bacterium]